MTDIQKIVEEFSMRAKKQGQDQKTDLIIRILSALYDKASAYTNLIIVAGYAAFFTIWGNMKIYLSRKEMLISALCISISCFFFIIWEITKMIISSRNTRHLYKVIEAPAHEFDKRLEEQQMSEKRLNIKIYRWWLLILILTIVPGLFGACVLINSFLRQLILD